MNLFTNHKLAYRHRKQIYGYQMGKGQGKYKLGILDEHIHTAVAAAAKLLQSCPTLCDPIDSSPPGSSVHGIFQAKVLEWVAIAFSDIHTTVF